jgi:tyrosine-protein phosphatase YwqE
MDNLYVVPEEIVRQCAHAMRDDDENTFKNFLEVAQEFRDAGLTPMYLCSHNMKDMYVTTVEKMRKKLH